MRSLIVCVLMPFCVIHAQMPSYGECPRVQTVKNFQLEQFMGLWFEQERYFNVFEMGAACVTIEYSMNGNSSISINNTEYNELTGQHSTLFGLSRYEGDEYVAKLVVEFPFIGSIEEPYWILDTDYVQFAVMWSCSDVYVVKSEYAWIMTRDRYPKEELILQIKDRLSKMDINISSFEKTDQTRCYK